MPSSVALGVLNKVPSPLTIVPLAIVPVSELRPPLPKVPAEPMSSVPPARSSVPVRLTVPAVRVILPIAVVVKSSPRLSAPPERAMPLPTAPVFVQLPVPDTVSRCTVPLLMLMLPVLLKLPRYQVLPETLALSTPWKSIVSSA